MHIPQSLQTIAKISIALAGFSGLIVALRRLILESKEAND